jgi:DNA-binding transcriptional regulator LsrR (DeoR family)
MNSASRGGNTVRDRAEDPFRSTQAAFAAKRHLVDRLTMKEVAAELGISRFTAARLVDWARANGIVQIEISSRTNTDFILSAALERAYGLKRALVVADLDGPSDSVRDAVGEVAAAGLAELISPTDVVGISWGRVLDSIVDQLPPLRARQVVQLVGGMASLESATSGVDLVRRLALRTSAEGLALIAPLIVTTSAAAESLRHEPMIAKTLRTIDSVTIAIAGIGSWQPPSSRLMDAFDRIEADAFLKRGVVADLCGIMIAADGTLLSPDDIDARRIGVLPTQLENMPTVVAVAGGREKHSAITAVLRSRMANVLITDAGAAHHALKSAGADAYTRVGAG